MTKETKIMLLLDKRDEALQKLDEEYNSRYATEGMMISETLELNMWHTEEKDKIEKAFIKGVMEL